MGTGYGHATGTNDGRRAPNVQWFANVNAGRERSLICWVGGRRWMALLGARPWENLGGYEGSFGYLTEPDPRALAGRARRRRGGEGRVKVS